MEQVNIIEELPVNKQYEITGGISFPRLGYLHKITVRNKFTGERYVFVNESQPITEDE